MEGDHGDGVEDHSERGGHLVQERARRKESRAGMRWSFRLTLFAASATILALEVVFLDAGAARWVLIALASVLVAGSAGLLTIGLLEKKEADRQKLASGIVGDVVMEDLSHEARILYDPATELQGRPDAVIRTKEGLVPVEVKSRAAPRNPFASHVMQVACYLHLLEVEGHTPPYGLLNYQDGVFRVAWGDQGRQDLELVLERMRIAVAEGKADRDHEHAGRCHGCARRHECDQRLK